MIDDRILAVIKSKIEHIHSECPCILPLDIRNICKRLDIEYYDTRFGPEVDGVYIRTSDGCGHVHINNHPSKPKGRRRFTAAHEIVHHLIADEMGLEQAFYLDSGSFTDPLEHACNAGGADLLMPRQRVREAFREVRMYPQAHILMALSTCFGVTRPAMRVRLEELGFM